MAGRYRSVVFRSRTVEAQIAIVTDRRTGRRTEWPLAKTCPCISSAKWPEQKCWCVDRLGGQWRRYTRARQVKWPGWKMMMMMMMMLRIVKRVLNSPQRRCQSIKQVALEMLGKRQRRERCGSKGSWQAVPDAWAGDRKTPHPQCCRRPWHE